MMKAIKSKFGRWAFGIVALALLILPARFVLGDYTLPQPGTALTGFSFTCFSTKVCPPSVLINSAGTEIGTAAAPVNVRNTGSSSAAINVSTATTTQLVALSGSTVIYVTSYDVIAGGTGNITFEYGTGSACGTGTTVLTGAYPLVAQAGISKGSGTGTILLVPAGNALCVLTSAAVQMSGSVSYLQF